MLSIFSVIIFLCITEYILSFFKAFDPSKAADPYVGLYDSYPLFTEKNGIAHTNTDKYPHMFPQSFSIKKSANTKRIFIFGGSNIYQFSSFEHNGKNFLAHFSESMKQKHPKYNWEIINCGANSWGTFHVAKLAAAAVNYDPDHFIVYSGHNDLRFRMFANNFNLLYVPEYIVALRKYVSQFRLYHVFRILLRKNIGTLLGFYTPHKKHTDISDSDFIDSFAKNISFVCTLTEKHNIDLTLCSVATNRFSRPNESRAVCGSFENKWNDLYSKGNELFKKIAPYIQEEPIDLWFSSEVMTQVTESLNAEHIFEANPFLSHFSGYDRRIVKQFFIETFTRENQRKFMALYHDIYKSNMRFTENETHYLQEALKYFRSAYSLYSEHAMLHFKIGICLYGLEQYDEAKEFLNSALSVDTVPARATPLVNRTIASIAHDNNVRFVDIKKIIESKSVHNIIGWDHLWDHCHLNDTGKYIIIHTLTDILP